MKLQQLSAQDLTSKVVAESTAFIREELTSVSRERDKKNEKVKGLKDELIGMKMNRDSLQEKADEPTEFTACYAVMVAPAEGPGLTGVFVSASAKVVMAAK